MSATIWTDSRGVAHDLTVEPRFSLGETARQFKCSVETIRRRIARGDIAPVLRNPRTIEVFQCAIRDYVARRLSTPKTK